MMITARTKAGLLAAALAAQILLAPVAGAAEGAIVWFPVGPGSEGSVFVRATTTDPFDLRTSGPTVLEFARISVDPGGTTGLTPRPGMAVTTVVEGVATVRSAGAGMCAVRTVNPGFATIEPEGSGSQIRNDGATPLTLYRVTFRPAGQSPASLSDGPCPMAAAQHSTVTSLNRSVVDGPLAVESKGLSDVYVGAARFAGQGVIPWHVQHRPLFGGVDRGTVTLDLASGDGCQTGVFPTGTGFHEPAQTVHEVRNDSGGPATFYYVVFAATPQPFLAPSPGPRHCEAR
jgi:quercetin dioxygenase-like cupin family protein